MRKLSDVGGGPFAGVFDDPFAGEDEEGTVYAQGRMPERTYATKSFTINRTESQDFGHPARFVYKVVDTEGESELRLDGEEWVVLESPGGRIQFKLLVSREAGRVKELWLQRVPAPGANAKIKTMLNLKREDAAKFVELLRTLDFIPVEGDRKVRVDDSLIRDLFADPDALTSVYKQNPATFRSMISDDETARDVVAVARRRQQLVRFRRLLDDADYFAEEAAALPGKGTEKVWQHFLEENPWILGVTLAGQLLTSWDGDKLEQAVTGRSIAGVGKRVDGLLRTSGRVRSMVFAEFKNHDAPLLHKEYRGGCWSASEELVGGVAQAQGTVHRAVQEIGDRLADTATDGSDIPGQFTYLIQPRSYLVIGRLDDLMGEAGGDHREKIRSFELYRRHLHQPEVITYDELLARAEWFVESSASTADGEFES